MYIITISLSYQSIVIRLSMTNYHLTPRTTLPSLVVQEAKEKRRRVLAATRQVRRENYRVFMQKNGSCKQTVICYTNTTHMTTEELDQIRGERGSPSERRASNKEH